MIRGSRAPVPRSPSGRGIVGALLPLLLALLTTASLDAQTALAQPSALELGEPSTFLVGERRITVAPWELHGVPVDGAREVTITTPLDTFTRTLGALPPETLVAPPSFLPLERWDDVLQVLFARGIAGLQWEPGLGLPELRWLETAPERWRLALVHELHFHATSEEREFWIAPENGELLAERTISRLGSDYSGTVQATVPADRLPFSLTVPTEVVTLPDLQVVLTGNGAVTTDENGTFSLTDPASSLLATASLTGTYIDVQNQAGNDTLAVLSLAPGVPGLFNFGDPTSEFSLSEANAYVVPSRARAWLLERSPGISAANVSVTVHVNIDGTCFASYLPIFQTIQLTREGGGCANAAYGTLLAHEYFHHIQNNLPVFGELEVEEANADIFAAYCLDDPQIGRHYFGLDNPLRDLSGPAVYPIPSPDPHISGLPLAAAFWDLREELIATQGETAGRLAAEELWLTWVLAGSGILDPGTLEEILMLDDDDGDFSNGTPNAAEILATFPPRGLDLPIEPPTQVQCVQVEENVELNWVLPTLSTHTSVEVHRNGVVVAVLPPDATSYVDVQPPAGFQEWFIVTKLGPGGAPSAACPLTLPPVFPFTRGDVDRDGITNLADAISLLTYLFAGDPILTCLDAVDFNDDADLNLADGLGLLNYLFGGGPPPPPPSGTPGFDPTPDDLLCS